MRGLGADQAALQCMRPLEFYVGVSRYLRRRWVGGEDLAPEESHHQKWGSMYLLGMYSQGVGQAEDMLIKEMKGRYPGRCTNVRGGGGGACFAKPSFLYICVCRKLIK